MGADITNIQRSQIRLLREVKMSKRNNEPNKYGWIRNTGKMPISDAPFLAWTKYGLDVVAIEPGEMWLIQSIMEKRHYLHKDILYYRMDIKAPDGGTLFWWMAFLHNDYLFNRRFIE